MTGSTAGQHVSDHLQARASQAAQCGPGHLHSLDRLDSMLLMRSGILLGLHVMGACTAAPVQQKRGVPTPVSGSPSAVNSGLAQSGATAGHLHSACGQGWEAPQTASLQAHRWAAARNFFPCFGWACSTTGQACGRRLLCSEGREPAPAPCTSALCTAAQVWV